MSQLEVHLTHFSSTRALYRILLINRLLSGFTFITFSLRMTIITIKYCTLLTTEISIVTIIMNIGEQNNNNTILNCIKYTMLNLNMISMLLSLKYLIRVSIFCRMRMIDHNMYQRCIDCNFEGYHKIGNMMDIWICMMLWMDPRYNQLNRLSMYSEMNI